MHTHTHTHTHTHNKHKHTQTCFTLRHACMHVKPKHRFTILMLMEVAPFVLQVWPWSIPAVSGSPVQEDHRTRPALHVTGWQALRDHLSLRWTHCGHYCQAYGIQQANQAPVLLWVSLGSLVFTSCLLTFQFSLWWSVAWLWYGLNSILLDSFVRRRVWDYVL